jgi:hypothetical protein
MLIIVRRMSVFGFKKKIGDKTVFLCDICGLGYSDKKTAQECEDYCKAHPGSCSVEISQKAVYLPEKTQIARNKNLRQDSVNT